MSAKHVRSPNGRPNVQSAVSEYVSLVCGRTGYPNACSSERILAEMEAADATVAADRVEPRGLLRLNAPVAFGTRQIAPLLAEFTERHPLVTIELGLNDRLVDRAEEGWDLG